MSVEELLKMTEKTSSAIVYTQEIRDKIFEVFNAASSSEQRGALLEMFTVTMSVKESWLSTNGTELQLAKFREDRANDYEKLLISESTVDDSISPVLLMATTNREIAARRMDAAHPLRRLAVSLAEAPQPSDAEMLAIRDARQRSDADIKALVDDLTSAAPFDLAAARKKIGIVWNATATSEQRGRVLAIFKAVMDEGEKQLVSQDDQAALLERFRNARDQDYKLLILQECTVGLHSPGGGQVCVQTMMSVTNREIAAGRMTEDHPQRKIAVQSAAAPHFSHAELVAQDKLKLQASKASPTSQTFGQKLKGLFRKQA